MENPFFKNTGPYKLNKLLKLINFKDQNFSDFVVNDIKDLSTSEIGDITFFHSKKYLSFAKTTKASFCITTENLKEFLPKNCKAIVSENVLLNTAQITQIFYPESTIDNFDDTVGMEYLVALHLNDSKSDVGSRVDRHDNIGMGKIGKAAFERFMKEDRLEHLAAYLETPGGPEMWKPEIAALRKLAEK